MQFRRISRNASWQAPARPTTTARCAAGIAAGAAALVLYFVSLERGVGYGDTAEYQTVAYILGIPHPTGFPGFVLLGWAWSHALPFGDVATRVNALSAVAIAATSSIVALLALDLDATPLVAVACALAFATARAPWTHATHIEAHSASLAVVATALLFALRWSRYGQPRDAALAVFASAVALALDDTTVLALAGVVILVVATRRGIPRGLTRALALGSLVVIAAYAYLPIRSAIVTRARLDPTLALGMPPGNSFWDDHHPATLAGFLAEVTGKEFAPAQAFPNAFRRSTFRQFAKDYVPALARDFTLPFIALAFAGATLLARRAPAQAAGFGAAAAIPLLFVFAYPEGDRVRYELISYAVIAALPAPAIRELALRARWIPRLLGAALLLVAALNLRGNADLFGHRAGNAGFLIGRVRAFTPDASIVLAPWDYATALAYASYVDHSLGSRVVVVTGAPAYVQRYLHVWLQTRRLVVLTDQAFDARGFRVRRLDEFTNPVIVELSRE